jgi:RNA polymerase sigma factor (sigma-70 family)
MVEPVIHVYCCLPPPSARDTIIVCDAGPLAPRHFAVLSLCATITIYTDAAKYLVILPSDDATILANVQAYFSCLAENRPVPADLAQAWEAFYERYDSLVRRVVLTFCRRRPSALTVDHDDLVQEVWAEILAHLPNLTYSAVRGPLSSWLSVLIWRKVRGLTRRQSHCRLPCRHLSEQVEDSLLSRGLGPDEAYAIKETCGLIESALAKFKARLSRKSYEVFYRRVVRGQSGSEIAAALDLTPSEVRYRHYRAMRKWRKLTRGMVELPASELLDAPPARRVAIVSR